MSPSAGQSHFCICSSLLLAANTKYLKRQRQAECARIVSNVESVKEGDKEDAKRLDGDWRTKSGVIQLGSTRPGLRIGASGRTKKSALSSLHSYRSQIWRRNDDG